MPYKDPESNVIMDDETLQLVKRRGVWMPDRKCKSIINKYGYTMGDTIGGGLFATVKSGYSKKLKKKVAIKTIFKTKFPSQDLFHERMIFETGCLQMCRHPYIVDFIEGFETEYKMYLITELLPNGDLLDYVNKFGYLSEEEGRRLFRQILDAVEFLHDANIYHRDIKLDNILLDENFNAKLADFGFATYSRKRDHLFDRCGTYGYVAPEILDGEPYLGHMADIFSMGVCLYAMVNGKLPFHEEDIDVLRQSMEEKVHFIQHRSTDCKRLIRAMLNPRPKRRIRMKQLIQHSWLNRPMKLSVCGAPLASQHSLASITSEHRAELPPQSEHGFSCAQRTRVVETHLVTNVLRCVAVKHCTGESRISLVDLESPLQNVSGKAAVLGVTGPVSKKIEEQVYKTKEYQIYKQASMGNLFSKTQLGKLARRGSMGAAIVRRLSMHPHTKTSSSSFVSIPPDRIFSSLHKLREDQIEKELRYVHYTTSCKAVQFINKHKHRHVVQDQQNAKFLENLRFMALPHAEIEEQERLKNFKNKCARMAAAKSED